MITSRLKKKEGDDSSILVTSICEGIIGGLEEKMKKYRLSIKGVEKWKHRPIEVTYLSVHTDEGVERLEFPTVFDLIHKDALHGAKVRYRRVHTIEYEFRLAMEEWEYSLCFIEGKYKGHTFEECLGFSSCDRGGP